MSNEETQTKEELLGSIQTDRAGGSVLTDADLVILGTPLAEGEAVYVLCSKHHHVFPVDEEGKAHLKESSGTSEITDWTGKYFLVTGCPMCTEDFQFKEPQVKDYRSA